MKRNEETKLDQCFHKMLSKNKTREISAVPFKVLDAPNLQDDYYLNVVDWAQDNNLAVALQDIVYLWNFNTNQVQ